VYDLLGICLVLATLLSVNAVASLLSAATGRLLERPLRRLPAGVRAELLFALRISPPTLALILVGLFLIPSYLGYEPYATTEIVSKKLAGFAAISAAGVVFTLWRGFRSWFATQCLLRKWLAVAQPINIPGITIPTFCLVHNFPVVAVVGSFRPRLFIAKRVLETLADEELKAAVAHEGGHLAAHDNLKRTLLRVCRDMLMIVPCGRSLDRAWSEAAECAADEEAARENAVTALNLASALVKIARMVPAGNQATMPLASCLIGVEETSGVKARIRRLLEIATNGTEDFGQRGLASILPLTGLFTLLLLAALVAINPGVLFTVHKVVERAVALLC
jgi:Zn-dependent protease with chaperone function